MTLEEYTGSSTTLDFSHLTVFLKHFSIKIKLWNTSIQNG